MDSTPNLLSEVDQNVKQLIVNYSHPNQLTSLIDSELMNEYIVHKEIWLRLLKENPNIGNFININQHDCLLIDHFINYYNTVGEKCGTSEISECESNSDTFKDNSEDDKDNSEIVSTKKLMPFSDVNPDIKNIVNRDDYFLTSLDQSYSNKIRFVNTLILLDNIVTNELRLAINFVNLLNQIIVYKPAYINDVSSIILNSKCLRITKEVLVDDIRFKQVNTIIRVDKLPVYGKESIFSSSCTNFTLENKLTRDSIKLLFDISQYHPLKIDLINNILTYGGKLHIILLVAISTRNKYLIRESIKKYAESNNGIIEWEQLCHQISELNSLYSSFNSIGIRCDKNSDHKELLGYTFNCIFQYLIPIINCESKEFIDLSDFITMQHDTQFAKFILNNNQKLINPKCVILIIINSVGNSCYRITSIIGKKILSKLETSLCQLEEIDDDLYEPLCNFILTLAGSYTENQNIYRVISLIIKLVDFNKHSNINVMLDITNEKIFELIINSLNINTCSQLLESLAYCFATPTGYRSTSKVEYILNKYPELYNALENIDLNTFINIAGLHNIIYKSNIAKIYGISYLERHYNERNVVISALKCDRINLSDKLPNLLLSAALAGDKEIFELIINYPHFKDANINEYMLMLKQNM